MNAGRQPPIFLERWSYRQRRMLDALRLLPVVGVMLWMLPLFWPTGTAETGEPVMLSTALTYIFGVWVLLTLLCAALWRVLRPTLSREAEPGEAFQPDAAEP
ncbi:MAG: hypothetical protein AAGG72_02690 [Pseudomonadota bacterium]